MQTSNNRSKYYKEYYQKYKNKILTKRKERYAQDKLYQQVIYKRSKARYWLNNLFLLEEETHD